MFSAALPVLVNVTVCDPLVVFTCWLANVRLGADKFTAGEFEDVPVPVRFTTCGLSMPLSVKMSVPVRTPGAVGVNLTQLSQPNPCDNPLPQ